MNFVVITVTTIILMWGIVPLQCVKGDMMNAISDPEFEKMVGASYTGWSGTLSRWLPGFVIYGALLMPMISYKCRLDDLEDRVSQLRQPHKVVELRSYSWLGAEFERNCRNSGDPVCKAPNPSPYVQAMYVHRGSVASLSLVKRPLGVHLTNGHIDEIYEGETVEALRIEYNNTVRLYLSENLAP